jgi:hypothetical protein
MNNIFIDSKDMPISFEYWKYYTHNKVKIQGKLSPNFETVVGLRQGDSLSTSI